MASGSGGSTPPLEDESARSRAAEVSGTSAGFAAGVRGIGSALVLNVALWLALAIWVPMNGFRTNFGIAAGVGVVALLLASALIVAVFRFEERLTLTITRLFRAIPGLDEEDVRPVVDRSVQQLRDLFGNRSLALRVAGLAAAYWLAEAASLWVILAAFGWAGSPLAVFVAFGVVNVLAIVPITPRGLGLVEAVLIPMLIALGAPGQVAALGVVTWRLLSFWAPIPIGTASYVSLRIREPDVGADDAERHHRAIEELATHRLPDASADQPPRSGDGS